MIIILRVDLKIKAGMVCCSESLLLPKMSHHGVQVQAQAENAGNKTHSSMHSTQQENVTKMPSAPPKGNKEQREACSKRSQRPPSLQTAQSSSHAMIVDGAKARAMGAGNGMRKGKMCLCMLHATKT